MLSEEARQDRKLRSALQDAEQANAAKTEAIHNIAHELRSALTAILGFSEMINEQIFGSLEHPRYAEYVEHIHFSANHLLCISNGLLDIAKIETGKQELDEQIVDVHKLMSSAISLVALQFQQNGVTIRHLHSATSPRARLDEQRMRQVLVNLLSNAAKFTPSGGSVNAEITVETDAAITITVRDTGIGIAPEDIDKVVVPFGRLRVARTSKTDGTGLGLALSKAIVEAHGGRLALISEVGSGTSVSVHLPAYRFVDVAAPATEKPPLVSGIPPRAAMITNRSAEWVISDLDASRAATLLLRENDAESSSDRVAPRNRRG
jgi:signal transduction histidine kinase